MRRVKTTSARSGVTTVEFALTAPLLFMFLFAALELGHANMTLNATEAAAYEGARKGIIPGASASECIQATRDILRISGIQNAQITVVPSSLSTLSDTVRVNVSVPYSRNTIVTQLFTKGLNINRFCEMTRESI